MIDLEIIKKLAVKRVGLVLAGKWTVERLLDSGGMASVYAARHRNGNRVAVKLLHKELCSHADSKQRFLREGYVANKVGHPGAVSVLDDDELDGAPFLVMELLEGESVEQRLRREKRLGVADALIIADEVLDVLAAAHDQGIVHRDIKPANLFLTSAGSVKVLDFGLARVREQSLSGSSTRTGILLGTVSYMPPEQARGKHDLIDARTDLWAIGATLFRLLTGRNVHEADSTYDRLVKHMSERAPSLGSVDPSLPESVVALVDRSLEYQKSDRFADARAMQKAVREAHERVLGSVVPSLQRRVLGVALAAPAPVVSFSDPDIHVSVVWDTAEEGSVIVEVEDEQGTSKRLELRRLPAQDEDEMSEVTVVEDAQRAAPPKPS